MQIDLDDQSRETAECCTFDQLWRNMSESNAANRRFFLDTWRAEPYGRVQRKFMGHQFYESRAERCLGVVRTELEQQLPNREMVANAGAKAVHNRMIALLAAGDIAKIATAVNAVLPSMHPDVSRRDTWLVSAVVEVFGQLKHCEYRDESVRIATSLLDKSVAGVACSVEQVFEKAASFFANQISESESVFRLPKDGLLGTQDLATDLGIRIGTRALRNILQYLRDDPSGWREGRWHAPRATKSRETENIGDEYDTSK